MSTFTKRQVARLAAELFVITFVAALVGMAGQQHGDSLGEIVSAMFASSLVLTLFAIWLESAQ